LQQSLAAAATGVVLGYLAVKSGSLLPGVLYHGVHNTLTVLIGRLTPDAFESQPALRLIFEPGGEAGQVVYRWSAALVAAALAACLLWWLKCLPYQRSTEERLQEALDRQPRVAPAQSAA